MLINILGSGTRSSHFFRLADVTTSFAAGKMVLGSWPMQPSSRY